MKNYVVLSDERIDHNRHLLRVDAQPGLVITSRSSSQGPHEVDVILLSFVHTKKGGNGRLST